MNDFLTALLLTSAMYLSFSIHNFFCWVFTGLPNLWEKSSIIGSGFQKNNQKTVRVRVLVLNQEKGSVCASVTYVKKKLEVQGSGSEARFLQGIAI